MSTQYGLSDEGYIAPRAADFLMLIRASYEADTGLTIDWEADTFLGTITTIMADQLGGLAEAGQAVYDAMDPNNAAGLQLDNISMMVGVTREAATYSTAIVNCTGTNGTIILEGSLIEGGGPLGTSRWAATANGTITGGTVAVVFQAVDPGAVEATIGALDTIVTAISGWTGATNPAVATAGTDRETDAELRKRRQASLQTSGSRSLNSMRANVLELDGVQACVAVQNSTMAAATVEGILLDPCSVGIVVYPSTLTTAQQEALARTIYETVSFGIATNGAQSATVTGADGVSHTVKWDWANTDAVVVAITVTLAAGFELDDVEEPIQELVADYFLALDVGDAARLLALLALVATIDGVDGAAITLDAVAADVDPDATTLLTLSGTATVTA